MSEKVFPFDLSEVVDPDIVKEVENIISSEPEAAKNFRRIVLAMQNIKYMDITDALTDREIGHFRSDPCTYFANSRPSKRLVIWNAAMKLIHDDVDEQINGGKK